MKKILLAGESWTSVTTHIKGFDIFTTSKYAEGAKWLINALEEAGYTVDFLRNHDIPEKFPNTMAELNEYSAVILSDCGTNTLLLTPDTFEKSIVMPNRCTLLKEYVLQGGGLCLVGGYLSFSGVDAKARFGQTEIKDVCPVGILDIDDRCEVPQGVKPVIIDKPHDIFAGIDTEWPAVLGYNKTIKVEGNGEVLATIGGNPFVAIGEYGEGRTSVFTSDCSPHWAPPEFCDWKHYNTFWKNLINWTIKN